MIWFDRGQDTPIVPGVAQLTVDQQPSDAIHVGDQPFPHGPPFDHGGDFEAWDFKRAIFV